MNSNISHGEFFSVDTVLRKYNDMKEGIKNPKRFVPNNDKMWLI